jgi:hypothetical protein
VLRRPYRVLRTVYSFARRMGLARVSQVEGPLFERLLVRTHRAVLGRRGAARGASSATRWALPSYLNRRARTVAGLLTRAEVGSAVGDEERRQGVGVALSDVVGCVRLHIRRVR